MHSFDLQRQTHVKIAITNLSGILCSKYLSKHKFLAALEKGFGFCDVIIGSDIDDQLIDDLTQTGWQTGYPDGLVTIDKDSGRRMPFEQDTYLFLSEYAEAHLCPRQVLRRITENAASQGYQATVGMEFEFTLFEETPQSAADKHYHQLKPLTCGNHGYSFLRTAVFSEFYRELLETCEAMDIELEGLHTEIGPGVLEAAIAKGPILQAADKAILFKHVVKTLAQRRGWMASFMAKWSNQHQGQSGHIHLSLQDEWGHTLFFDSGCEDNISDTLRHFIGGQQCLMPEWLILSTPTVNSYNRLTPGFWAPTQASWGVDNRTCALRVINNSESATRIEYRIPGADSNPYLAMSAALASGLWGIEQGLMPSVALTGNAYEQNLAQEYQLPQTIEQAAMAFRQSEAASCVFGKRFVNDYATSREWEAKQARKAITDWQLQRYFELA